MQLLRRLFGKSDADPRDALRPLYTQIVEHARQPHWYLEGGVPDSVNGRFEMVSAMFAQVLLRLEKEPDRAGEMAFLTEIFVADMDAQLREIGVGDMIVGKRVGKLVGAFGGRLGAYRDALARGDDADLKATLQRNLYGDHAPSDAQLTHTVNAMRDVSKSLSAVAAAALVAGEARW